MHRVLLGVVLFGLVVSSLRAQVSAEIRLEQSQYLPRESLVVAVRITNFSGQTLRFGADNAWLTFSVESTAGLFVEQQSEVSVKGEFDLETASVATKRVDLSDAFHLAKPGTYTVTAAIRLADWPQEVVTAPVKFEVIKGVLIWEQDFGVPDSGGEGRPPVVRKYALMQALHQNQLKLYARVSDMSVRKIHRLFTLGPVLSYGNPEQQIGRDGNLYVLFPDGARRFNYSVIDPDGALIARQTFEYTDTRPTLRSDAEGKISVGGGLRRQSLTDVPSAPVLPPKPEVPSAVPPSVPKPRP